MDLVKFQELTGGYITEDTLYYAWDITSECKGMDCIAARRCPYSESGFPECRIQDSFLKSLSNILSRNFVGKVSEVQLYGFGIHLVPLYKSLCSLYIQELAVEDVSYSVKGRKYIHPVYKEIRDTVLIIGKEWNRLGLNSVMDSPGFDSFKDGDSNYYSKLEASYMEKPEKFKNKKLKRKKRK